ncbi:hypothetical protein BKA70DRAFT_1313711 [Coprinopsis sp. MPI-PUGE-AT-0042]|nr:hypothetical protein BKA70DRAFT_1313711 [Coprinopsis sp. MPI-PUGE-AT-0042]
MLSHLSLFIATRPQIEESRRRSYPEWGKGMSPEAFEERDNLLDRSEVAGNDRFTTWVLAPRDDPETLDFMCACETFRREVFVSRTDPPTPGGLETGYAIASVFTPPDKRGKGYAKHMMRLLHWIIARPDTRPSKFPEEWGEPPAQVEGFMNASVSVLYSDVGTDFYAGCGFLPGTRDGWIVAPRAATIWKVSAGSETHHDAWRWLSKEELDVFWEKDSEIIAREMKEHGLKGQDAAFSFTPRHGVAAFQPLRIQQFIEEEGPIPTFYGVTLKSQEETLAYASWTFQFPSFSKLIITRLRVPGHLFGELISAIMGYCKERGMEEIEVWNLQEDLVSQAASMGATTADMENHLPSVKWYSLSPSECVEWMNNEKFSWC